MPKNHGLVAHHHRRNVHHYNEQHSHPTKRGEDEDEKKKQDKYGKKNGKCQYPGGPLGLNPKSIKINGVYIGFIIEGENQKMIDINNLLEGKAATYGKYSQVRKGKLYTGEQLLYVMDEVIKSGAVFQPTLMPESWEGFTWEDNRQAVAVAKVLKKFTDACVPVWLRAFHEVNWYQFHGECPGTAEDFKLGWEVLAKAIKDIAPEVKMWWCPNLAHNEANPMSEYKKYQPRDMSTVDLVGIDFYPRSHEEQGRFLDIMLPFYKEYVKDGRKFALGESGLHYNGNHQERVDWLVKMTLAQAVMPDFIAITWYNCKKEWDYKLVGKSLNNYALREKFA